MKKQVFSILCCLSATFFANEMSGQTQKENPVNVKKDTVVSTKEEKNRNVMLNASSASQPRQINIGIPAGGDLLIMENELPVIYTFYPQIPTSVWKYDATIGRVGLLSLAEGALTFGKVGFCVNSYDREASYKFKGFFTAYTSSYGSLIYSGNLSGPLGKNGWGYNIGFHETFDRGPGIKRMYTPWEERAEMFKIGLSKKYKNGSVKLLFKHSTQRQNLNNYQPFVYQGKGNFTQYSEFETGRDSYLLGDGKLAYTDADTGEVIKYNLGDDKFNKNISDALYLYGDHSFKKGYKLEYSTMFMKSTSPFNVQFPLSLGVRTASSTDASNRFYYHGTSTAYDGLAQMVASALVEPTDITTSLTKVELTNKFGVHNLRLGLTSQYYETGIQKTNSAIYYQTVAANPQLLDWKTYYAPYNMWVPVTNSDGIMGLPGKIEQNKTVKTALFFSDNFSAGKRFNFNFGARIEKHDETDTHTQYMNQYVNGRDLMVANFNNKYNHVVVGGFVANVTDKFGFLGDVVYNDYFTKFYDYPGSQKDANGNPLSGAETTVANSSQIKVLNYAAGIFYNAGDKFSIVSKVNNISKSNNVTSMDIYNPSNPTEKFVAYPLFYDISTFGWTTDIVTSPFKNFSLHYLITLQNPLYKNYKVNAFGQTYDYSDNKVPGLSQMLMEIDPSYKIGNLKLWASVRYFGKQYGNLSNAIYYNSWWENFVGLNYTLSPKVDFKFQVTNFLNQKGISGTIQGGDQITAATEPNYVGKIITAQSIRPRMFELTVNFKL